LFSATLLLKKGEKEQDDDENAWNLLEECRNTDRRVTDLIMSQTLLQ
jgi:hypothetical protein